MSQRSKVNRRTVEQAPIQPAKPVAASTSRTIAPESFKLSNGAGAILFVLAACWVCLGYSFYTGQTWEDSLIILRHSENLLKGNGLT